MSEKRVGTPRMIKFDELSPVLRQKAIQYFVDSLLKDISEGCRFSSGSDLQIRIDAAGQKAASMHTPWFWLEYIMEDKAAVRGILDIAMADARIAVYLVPGEGQGMFVRVNQLERTEVGQEVRRAWPLVSLEEGS